MIRVSHIKSIIKARAQSLARNVLLHPGQLCAHPPAGIQLRDNIPDTELTLLKAFRDQRLQVFLSQGRDEAAWL